MTLMDAINEAVNDVLQLRYPKEFRIGRPYERPSPYDTMEKAMKVVYGPDPRDKAIKELGEEISGMEAAIKDISSRLDKSENEKGRLIAEICTGLWRIRKNLAGMDDTTPGLHKAMHSMESAWDTLADRGIEVQGHDDEEIFGGENLRILTFQPMPGITKDTVIDTIKPTIFFREKKVQVGEVIVGTPETPATGMEK